MKLNEKWNDLVSQEMEPQQSKKFWEAYFLKEKEIYEDILGAKRFNFETTIREFSEKYAIEPSHVIGFIDGINTSLKEEIQLDELEEESSFQLDIDIEKLFYNMHEANADWLYSLPQWDELLSAERRKEIEKEYKASKTVILEEKTGRNDPCPCGSGKKYKKCCGRS